MIPLLAAAAPIIAGGIGAIGQHGANQANAEAARKAQEFSAAEAEKNRGFQERMSNSEYQRKVEDLKKAGLNPALAYGGGGASSPSGSTAAGVASRADNVGGAAFSSAQGAAQIQAAAQQREQSAASVSEILSRADLTSAQAQQVRVMTNAQLAELRARTGLHSAQSVRADVESQRTRQLFPHEAQVMEANWLRIMADTAIDRARLGGVGAQSEILQNLLPASRNAKAAAETLWGKKVAPYLNDAGAVTRIFTPWMR